MSKKSCYTCSSFSVIKWGTQNQKQRFKCKLCGQLFIWRNDGSRLQKSFIWFKNWVIGKQTFDYISKDSGYSKSTLQRLFINYLNKPPVFKIPQKETVHILIDGTYFTNDICLVVYRNNDIKCTQLYRISTGEIYEEIKEDLENIKALGIQVNSITCDGHPSILKAIKKVYKNDVIMQRCVVHIQRMSRIWLTKEPKSLAGINLLYIVNQIHKIATTEQKLYWLRALYDWDQQYHEFINEKSVNPDTGRMWYTHKMIRRVRYTLVRAFPNMFNYIENENIPKSTNALESFFGHLKDNLSIHRGLTLNHRKNFIKWYLYLRNEE